ncbi:twin-arginine translocase subunit TatB [Thiomicrospira microaerophila]|uniref:Sec-independent protein translocase protein TatB n=1 Tax=Thiomicrospira microaerophila TaxID=406020 RepID=UPI00200C2872|nr:Sec-independent protein translocase protein TatB [Thiomicrospira microaerophila]UQB42067.1 twin-arginine translocase subunit TatB [Thiomicrospira microaerophila]
MFDFGFLEIVVVLVITLLVVGPERMPEVARKAGQMVGKFRNFINSVKDDSNLRDTVRELQQAVDLKEEQKRFESIQQDLYKGFDDVKDQINFDELQRPFGQSVIEPTKQDLELAKRQLESTNDVETPTAPNNQASSSDTDDKPKT